VIPFARLLARDGRPAPVILDDASNIFSMQSSSEQTSASHSIDNREISRSCFFLSPTGFSEARGKHTPHARVATIEALTNSCGLCNEISAPLGARCGRHLMQFPTSERFWFESSQGVRFTGASERLRERLILDHPDFSGRFPVKT
jgi:hypothetical protein